MSPWSTQPLTEMITRNISWGKGGRCIRLTTLPPSCAVVMKSGNLNYLELSGPVQAYNGTVFDSNILVPRSHKSRGVTLPALLDTPACNGITLPSSLIKFRRVLLTLHCLFMYVLNTSGWQTLHQITPAQVHVCNLKALTCHHICGAVCCCCVCVE